MKILTLACNECGAPLEVPAKTRFLTCTFCSSQLEVHHSGNAAYTEIKELAERTDQLADDIKMLKQRSELESLDREWLAAREQHIVQGQFGPKVPTKGDAELLGILFSAAGVMFLTLGIAMLAGGTNSRAQATGALMFIPALLCFIFGGVGYLNGSTKARAYDQARQHYQARRREILGQTANPPGADHDAPGSNHAD